MRRGTRPHPALAALAALAVLAAAATGFAAAVDAPGSGAGIAPAHDASIQIEYEGDSFTLPPTTGATVHANTSLDPGTELTFRVESKGEPSFVSNATATVAADGTVDWTLDLSAGEVGQGFQIDVFVGDEVRPTLGMGGKFAEPSTASTPGQPGFGAAVALVAVLLAAVAAARRR